MIGQKGVLLLGRVWAVVVLSLLALGVAEWLTLGSDYLLSILPLFLLPLCCAPFLRRQIPTADTERRLPSPATAGVQASPRVKITRGADELHICIGPAGALRQLLMAVCPVGLATVPGWIAWAALVDPPPVWAFPALALLVAFALWLAVAHLAMNLLQGFWGTTYLALTGDSLCQTVVWQKRRWIERHYRLGPETRVRSDVWPWFGIMVQGVRGEPASPWWKSLLLLRAPAQAISFGASLEANDAQVIADCIEDYLRCRQTGRGDTQDIRAEPVAAADGGRDSGFSEFTVSQRGRRC
jgi:hypothetical protein